MPQNGYRLSGGFAVSVVSFRSQRAAVPPSLSVLGIDGNIAACGVAAENR
jgi:hypothetical protein